MASLFKWCLVLLVCFVTSTSVCQAQTFSIDSERVKVNLIPFTEYNGQPDNGMETPPVEGWVTYANDDLKLGFDRNVHWLRTEITNPNPMPLSMYLELGSPLIDQVNVYLVKNGKVTSAQTLGDTQAFHLRPVLQEKLLVPISILADETIEVYISFQSQGLLDFALNLWQKEAFQEYENRTRLSNGLILGIAIAAIVGCLLLAAHQRSLIPALDAGLLLSLLLIINTLNGYSFHYLWPELPAMQQHAIYILSCLGILCSALLARYNLRKIDHEHQHILAKMFTVIALFAIAFVPLTLLLSYQLGLYLIVSAVILICLAHVATGVWIWRQGVHENQEVNFGLAVLLTSLFVIAINNFTSLPLPFNNVQLLQFSLLLMVLSIAVSLLRTPAHPKTNAEPRSDDELQEQLANQNFELEVALRELQERNQELEKLNTLDALSGIHNRRHFDKRILAELRRSRRELTPLALVMFDIDHFKRVNDNYGHLTGDEVIRSVAHIAQEQLNRSADEIFRYGGEEYALILPNTEVDGAAMIAEKVRAAVESLVIQGSSEKVRCTISLGVAVSDARQAMSPEQLIEQSDSALYKAKQSGRNQVVIYQAEDN